MSARFPTNALFYVRILHAFGNGRNQCVALLRHRNDKVSRMKLRRHERLLCVFIFRDIGTIETNATVDSVFAHVTYSATIDTNAWRETGSLVKVGQISYIYLRIEEY